MPPLPNVPNVLKVVIGGFVDAEDIYKWANVLHFLYTGGAPTAINCADLASAIGNEWLIHMNPECPANTSQQFITVTDLTSPTAGEGEDLTPRNGSRGDDNIPANAALLIRYPVTTRYRGGHPRQYLYVGGNADLEGAAKWSTLFTAEAQSHWRAFLAAIESLSTGSTTIDQMCAVSYYSKEVNPVPPFRRPVPLVLRINTPSAVAVQEIASQRRRVGRAKR
jgi:hypothetical protein